jgi:dTDP-4-amino-4,6-dideoxygalactose transaminase
MTDIQASVGIKQLEKLDWLIQERRKIADRYHQAFNNIDCITPLAEPADCFSNYQSYSIYLKPGCPISRNDLMQKLLDAGIATRRGVMTAHRESAYRDRYQGLHLPVSEDLADRSIIIPLFVPMKEEEVEYVIENFRKLVSGS